MSRGLTSAQKAERQRESAQSLVSKTPRLSELWVNLSLLFPGRCDLRKIQGVDLRSEGGEAEGKLFKACFQVLGTFKTPRYSSKWGIIYTQIFGHSPQLQVFVLSNLGAYRCLGVHLFVTGCHKTVASLSCCVLWLSHVFITWYFWIRWLDNELWLAVISLNLFWLVFGLRVIQQACLLYSTHRCRLGGASAGLFSV